MPNENLAFKKNNRFALKIFREASPNKKIQNYSEEDQRKIINFLSKYVDKNTPEAIKNWSKNNPNKNFHTMNNANKSRIIRETKEAIQRWSKNYPSRNFYAMEDGYKKRIIRETKSKIKKELNASAKPVNNKPVNNKPVNNKPVNNKPVNNKPVNNNKTLTSKNLSAVKMLMSGYTNNAENAFLKHIIKSLKHSMHPNKYPKPRNENKWGPNGYPNSYKGLREKPNNANKVLTNDNKSKLNEIRKILNSNNSNNTKYNKIKNMF